MLGNLRTFTALGEKEKMLELENELVKRGYRNEDNCEKNKNTDSKTWHIYDLPKTVVFSVLDQNTIDLLKTYGNHFNFRVGIAAEKII